MARHDWWTIGALTLLVIDAGLWAMIVQADAVNIPFGRDFGTYHDAAASWLAGAGFYHPYQLAGQYIVTGFPGNDPILYPPTILPLLAVFTVLPAFLWWAPLAIVGYVVARAPRDRQLLCLALCFWPQTIGMIGAGNPAMWIVAALALATRWPGFAPFVLLKPSLAPFALYRVHRAGWWVGLVAFTLVSLAFLPMWLDWLRAIRNSDADIGYSLTNFAPLLIPLIARPWSPMRLRGSPRRSRTTRAT